VHPQRPGDLPNRPARAHQPQRLHPHRPRIGPPRPATLQAARPPGRPEASNVGVDPPPLPPVPRCVLAPAAPAGLGRTGRLPVRVAVLCATGVPTAAAADPAAEGGVGGWSASQASTAAIASACSCARRPHRPIAAPRW
jgi:hypothetical protein